MSNKMKNMRARLLLLFAAISLSVSAQVITVTGTVTDNTGEPVIGASVVEKGNTTNGTITDFDGNFSLSLQQNATLVLSYIGMRTQEVPVQGKTRINVVLEDDAQALDEVVVIGYGTAKRKDLTGSVASVSADAIAAVPVASAVEAMAGKLAGVQISATEGSPDAEIKIRVRGGGSITGDNTPLLIVDGFPVESISDIAPSDIESIDVLKDASSTAIYGSRGANGVIIVTTKSGKEGKINVNYNAFVSWKSITKTLDVLSPEDYVKWHYEYTGLRSSQSTYYTPVFGNWQDIDLYSDIPANDWQDITFGRTGFTFNHNLSITGGTDKAKYAFSYSMIDDKAIMQMSNYRRDNLSLKLNTKPHKRIGLDFSIRYSKTTVNGSGTNEQNEKSSGDSRLRQAILYPPFAVEGLTDTGSEDTDDISGLYQPLINLADNDQKRKQYNYNMSASFNWELIDNLKLRAEVGMDDYRRENNRFYGMTTYYIKNQVAEDHQNHPAVVMNRISRQRLRSTNTLNYDFKKQLKNTGHNLNLLVGQEYILTKEKDFQATVAGFPTNFTADEAFRLTTQGSAASTDNYSYPDDILLSYFSRVNYDYQSKYILSATFRADGSSKFGDGNKWGFFPSAAVAWRISSEPFMQRTETWLDDLKLRFSYGTAGNNAIPSGQIERYYESSTTVYINNRENYWAPSKYMPNPDLKWETTQTRNLGLDFTTFNGRLSGTAEVYLNTTKDLLIEFPVSGSGYEAQYRNMGKTQNKGLELTLNWNAIEKKNYGLSFSGNINFNRNKIKSLGEMDDFLTSSTWHSDITSQMDYIVAAGGRVGQMYGYVTEGRYEVDDFNWNEDGTVGTLKTGVVNGQGVLGNLIPGSLKLKDLNGDGSPDRTIIGDANPKHTGGFTINGRIYDFDISAAFTWSYGNDIYNANKIEYTSTNKYWYRNMTSEMAAGKRWTYLNTDGTIASTYDELKALNANTTMWTPYMGNYMLHSWAIEDGSFLRLNTLTLGYTFPKELISKVNIQNLRLYATGYNLFCWTSYSGMDPEVSTRRKTNLTPGVDYSAYPKSRQFVLGLNLTF